jgi:hypothetical protein
VPGAGGTLGCPHGDRRVRGDARAGAPRLTGAHAACERGPAAVTRSASPPSTDPPSAADAPQAAARGRVKRLVTGVNGVVAFVATVVGLFLALGIIKPFGGGDDAAAAAAAAASRLGNADTVASVTIVSVRVNGKLVSLERASSQADLLHGRDRAFLDASQVHPNPGFRSLRFVRDGPVGYLRREPSRHPRRPWARIDFARAARQTHNRFLSLIYSADASAAPTDLSQSLAQDLKHVNDVHELGAERSFGVPVTHYRGTYDGGAALQSVGADRATAAAFHRLFGTTWAFDLWVDGNQLPRRYRASAGKGRNEVSLDTTLSDYGRRVRVRIPPATKVRPLHDYVNWSDM